MSQTTHSYHIFLFPFKWETFQGKNHAQSNIDQRYPLDKLPVDTNYWQPFTFKAELDKGGFHTYNEYAYFYEHTRDVLNVDDIADTIHLRQFSYSGITPSSTYQIDIQGSIYTLSLENILVNYYESGVGVLSFFLRNTLYIDKKDIFRINDFGRRIFPQYLGNQEPFTAATKGSFLAQSIKLTDVRTCLGSEVVEDFSHYDTQRGIKKSLFVLPRHFKALFGPKYSEPNKNVSVGNVLITPMLDDRMFTICIFYDQAFINQLATRNKADDGYKYLSNSNWYQMVFVDGQYITCHSPEMMKEQLENATYDRWLSYKNDENGIVEGHLFGVSRYSFVVVAAPAWYNQNIVIKHITHQYFQMVLLSLVQRAYIVNFSGEVARISQYLNKNQSFFGRESSQISALYRQYIKFVNRIFFREVTPQEQGIELYEKIQLQMRIREDVKDLDDEINELNSYAEAQQQNHLTLIAGWFAVSSLIATIIGLNPFWNDEHKWTWVTNIGSTEWNTVAAIGLIIGSLFASNLFLKLLSKTRRKK